MLCMVFLGQDEKANADTIARVSELRNSLKHKIHIIVFPADSQQDKPAEDIINACSISKFPAVVVDGKLLAQGKSLQGAYEEAARRKTIDIDQHLATDIIDSQTLVAMFYVCSYVEGQTIENGRVMVYVTKDNEYQAGVNLPSVFIALIADSKDYYVLSNSCHAPEKAYWEFPEDIEAKTLKVIMVVYDGEGNILGTCCSADDCMEGAE